jgi:hypothetical protein
MGKALPPSFVTTSGSIDSCSKIIHSWIEKDSNDLKTKLIEVFKLADDTVGLNSLVVPFPDFNNSESQIWALSQDCIESLIDFHKARTKNRQLSQINIACNSLLQADVLKVVCNQLLTVGLPVANSRNDVTNGGVDTSITPVEPEPTTNATEWHTVKEVLKRRKVRNKVQYLVRWESDDSESWVPRSDLTDAAVQSFIAKQSRRKRARKC